MERHPITQEGYTRLRAELQQRVPRRRIIDQPCRLGPPVKRRYHKCQRLDYPTDDVVR